MNTNSKIRILMLVAVILLLTNICMLVFFLYNKESGRRGAHGGREGMMTEFLQKEIGFTPQQIQQYDSLNKQHREKMKALFEEAGKNREAQVKQLAAAGFSDSVINSISIQSAEKQKQLMVQMFGNLKDIRQICSPAQLPKFDSLIYKVIGRHGGDVRKKPGDNK
jgi:protein CpxP